MAYKKTVYRRLKQSLPVRRQARRHDRANSANNAPALMQPLEPRLLMAVEFTLQLLHASDLEGGVDAIGNAPNFAAIVDALEDGDGTDAAAFDASVTISAGDNYLPGPFFSASGDFTLRDDLQAAYQNLFGEPGLTNIREGVGRADVSIMNIIGFDASAVGNHEFDAGTTIFREIIGTDIQGRR